MWTLDRYIATTVVIHFAYALAALLAVFSMINALQELRDVGIGDYGATEALWFTLLTAPNEAYQLFPAAALVGGISGLGVLAANNEIVAIWAAGVPKGRLIRSVLQAGAALVVVAVVTGELVGAPLARRASRDRAVVLSAGKAMGSAKGLWARDGNRFINIRDPSEGNVLRDIYVYEFGPRQALERFWYLRDATYDQKRWLAEGIVENRITDTGVVSEHHDRQEWQVPLTPKQIRLVSLPPEYLSLAELWRSSTDLAGRRENPHRYQLAFWNRATIPFVTLVMMALAVPLVLTSLRDARLGQRTIIGALLGVGFQMFTETFATFGLAYDVPPLLNAIIPISIAATAAVLGIRRMAN